MNRGSASFTAAVEGGSPECVVVSAREFDALTGCSKLDLTCMQKPNPVMEPFINDWSTGSVLCSSELAGRD